MYCMFKKKYERKMKEKGGFALPWLCAMQLKREKSADSTNQECKDDESVYIRTYMYTF